MDLEFDFKGDPIGGVISNCKSTRSLCFSILRKYDCVTLNMISSYSYQDVECQE